MYPFQKNKAKHFLRNSVFTYKQLKPFTGTNPLLLTHAIACNNIHEARAKVRDRVTRFLANHRKKTFGLHEHYIQSLQDTTYLLHATIHIYNSCGSTCVLQLLCSTAVDLLCHQYRKV